jgi:hypothetical protein
MNYELAKKLKDAGFPQEIDLGDRYYDPVSNEVFINGQSVEIDFCSRYDSHPELGQVKIPSLSELIEECGKHLSHIKQYPAKGHWFAVSHTKDYKKPHPLSGNNIEEDGDSPEEAVAKLWIEINEK